MSGLGPCRGAHRACPDRAPATVLQGSRAMCERCAADRRRARNQRKSRGRAVDRIEGQLAKRDGPGRPPLQPDGSRAQLNMRLAPEDEAAIDELAGPGERSAAVRDLLRAHAESPAVRAAVAAWRSARAR